MIKNLIDKIFFAVGVMLFLQLPHFIDQYTQRMGGYADSQKQQIQEYQTIADQHFNGDLDAYMQRLQLNADPAVAESAEQMDQRLKNAASIEKELKVFEQEALWYQVPYFISHIRYDLAKGTAENFSPGLPLNLWAWGYGLIGGVLFSLLFNGAVKLPRVVRRKSKQQSFSRPN
ncbi:DUF2937 family protein [Marinicella litoralis]|uniref:DUF2937 family protein n=1 Tax=Marinicella litoralis TaxID=644220 RepID=A0A4R6XNL8_9GAMM|nr:DUF2937 family protein [Marinicella litoralis]TDR19317.1 hypothetical protein C8D91_1865 [Marinicella litoralis]